MWDVGHADTDLMAHDMLFRVRLAGFHRFYAPIPGAYAWVESHVLQWPLCDSE